MNNVELAILFNCPRLIISNHFDDIINYLDVHTENLFYNSNLNNNDIIEINLLRDEIIENVKRIEEFNYNYFDVHQLEIYKEFDLIDADESYGCNLESKFEAFKELLIRNDCYLLKDLKSKIGFALYITSWYNGKAQLEFLKNFNTNGKNNPSIFNEVYLEILDQSTIKNLCILEMKTSNHNSDECRVIKDFRNTNFDSIKKLNITSIKVKYVKENSMNAVSNLEKLEIFDCELENNNFKMFKILNNLCCLKELYLSDNPIYNLDDYAFSNLKQLKILNLMFCKLTKINHKLFAGLNNLEILDLSYNPMVIEEDSFKHLSKLKVLNLNFCKLKRLNGQLFENLSSLEKLNISRNPIESMGEDSFKNLISLRKLYINDCKIKKIGDTLFESLTNLEILSISENRIETIVDNSFKNLKKLKRLYLYDCKLKAISNKLFKHLFNLEELDISNNPIECIHNDVFKNLNKLKILNLIDCNLKYLSINFFSYLTNLEELDISNNPLIENYDDLFRSLDNSIKIFR